MSYEKNGRPVKDRLTPLGRRVYELRVAKGWTLEVLAEKSGLCVSTIGGLLTAKIMNKFCGGTITPLIGSAGVSAVPMAARVAQTVGQKEDPSNFLLMHAMGPNVAGVIGSAVAAGVFLSWIG